MLVYIAGKWKSHLKQTQATPMKIALVTTMAAKNTSKLWLLTKRWKKFRSARLERMERRSSLRGGKVVGSWIVETTLGWKYLAAFCWPKKSQDLIKMSSNYGSCFAYGHVLAQLLATGKHEERPLKSQASQVACELGLHRHWQLPLSVEGRTGWRCLSQPRQFLLFSLHFMS